MLQCEVIGTTEAEGNKCKVLKRVLEVTKVYGCKIHYFGSPWR